MESKRSVHNVSEWNGKLCDLTTDQVPADGCQLHSSRLKTFAMLTPGPIMLTCRTLLKFLSSHAIMERLRVVRPWKSRSGTIRSDIERW